MRLSGWGRFPWCEARVLSLAQAGEAASFVGREQPFIVRGLGRSYGDSALAQDILLTRRFNHILDFCPSTGALSCEAGVSLDEIIAAFLPRGWFLPVVPGTRFVTVGGAIAGDVHGKNHHSAGCFSSCVRSLVLLLPNGEVRTCSPTDNRDLFTATCGGMGLTGVILAAELALRSVSSSMIEQKVVKARNLAHTLELFEEHGDAEYSVAWVDTLAQGEGSGRSLLILGEHAPGGPLRLAEPKAVTIPSWFPGWLLGRPVAKIFNNLKYSSISANGAQGVVPLHSFFFPLDGLLEWNRLYGRKGFTQYQFVIPKQGGPEGLAAILSRIAGSGLASYLAVLKLFGPANANMLSFPMAGYTLALDFKISSGLPALLHDLDRMVREQGGRLYLAKDARMEPAMLEAGYPGLAEFRDLRRHYGMDTVFSSLQSKRLGV